MVNRHEDEPLGIIQDLIAAPLSEEEKIRILQEYLPVRTAFEHFLAQGKRIDYPTVDRVLLRVKGQAFWTRDKQVNTSLGPVDIDVSTSGRGSKWGKDAHDIPNAKIRIFLSKENDTPEGIVENSAHIELLPVWAASDPFETYISLNDLREITKQLGPLVAFMKEQSLI